MVGVHGTPDTEAGNRLLVHIEYRVIATNTIFNLVYPFYLTEGVGGDRAPEDRSPEPAGHRRPGPRAIPLYVPAWTRGPGQPRRTGPRRRARRGLRPLHRVLIERLNRAPDKNFLAFLDMIGVSLLPPIPARAPVQFARSPPAPARMPSCPVGCPSPPPARSLELRDRAGPRRHSGAAGERGHARCPSRQLRRPRRRRGASCPSSAARCWATRCTSRRPPSSTSPIPRA